MDRDREVLAKRLDGERASREELQGEMLKLQRQAQALENVEEMLFKERAQRQRAERSIVELARSLGTLKAALLHAGIPVPPEARPSSALQNTVQVLAPFEKSQYLCCCQYFLPMLSFIPPSAPRTSPRRCFRSQKTCSRNPAATSARRGLLAHRAIPRLVLI